jgi:hypothetical protein
MSPPAGNIGRLSGFQGEKPKRAEGSAQQGGDILSREIEHRIRPGGFTGRAYPLISYEIP